MKPHKLLALATVLGTARCLDGTTPPLPPPPPPPVVRVVLTAVDTAGLVGTTLQLTATGYDRLGAVVDTARFVWQVLDPTRASVDTTGQVVLGPAGGDARVVAADSQSGRADTLSLHAAVEGEVKWRFVPNGQLSTVGGPALGPDGTVYVLTAPYPGVQEVSDLVAVSPSGQERWRRRLDRTAENGHLVGPDGTIYVIGRTVRAISPQGNEQWGQVLSGASGAVFMMGALAAGGPLVVAGENSPLALSLVAGDTIWGGPVSPIGAWLVPPTIAGPTVWIKKTEDSLYAFSLASGAIGRQIADPDSGVDKRSFGTGPVPLGASLFAPTAFRLAAFDTGGALIWLTAGRGRGVSEPVIDALGNLYLQTRADGLVALDPLTGAPRWQRVAAEARWAWYGGPALAQGGILYAAALDGFYAYDTTGTLQWSYQTPSLLPFIGAPVIAPDGTVYTYTDFSVYAFWASRPPEPNSPWAMWRHDAQRTGRAW